MDDRAIFQRQWGEGYLGDAVEASLRLDGEFALDFIIPGKEREVNVTFAFAVTMRRSTLYGSDRRTSFLPRNPSLTRAPVRAR